MSDRGNNPVEYGCHEIRLDTTRSWPVMVGAGIIGKLAERFDCSGYTAIVLIADRNVARRYGEYVKQALEASGKEVTVIVLPAGERTKSLRVAERVYKELLENGIDRRALFCVLGGGVIGDLGGYLAATYLRGVDYLQLPTTLLAQVDSSIGGKVGVNFGGKKNLVGAFYQPRAIICDVALLRSLSRREKRNGLTEVIKYGLAMDAGLLDLLEARGEGDFSDEELAGIVLRCGRLKAGVIERDETERSGPRAILNFGHTVGHALEAVTGLCRLTHGEAVAVGMVAAARLSQRLGMLPPDGVARVERVLQKYGLPTACPGVSTAELIDAIRYDKKTTGGETGWVLLEDLGQGVVGQTVETGLVREVLEEMCR